MTDDNIKPRDRHLLTRVAEAAQVAADSGRRCPLAEILDELGVAGHEFQNARARARKADPSSPLLGRLADAHATLSVGAKRRKRAEGEETDAPETEGETAEEEKPRRKRQGATAAVGPTEAEQEVFEEAPGKWPEIDAVTTAMEGVVHCLSPLDRQMQLRVIRAACLLLEIEDEFVASRGGRNGGSDGEEDGQGRGRGGRGGGSGRGKQQQRRAGASRRKD